MEYDDPIGPLVTYTPSGAVFLRRCPKCARFAKADGSIRMMWLAETPARRPNATCSVHGRVEMEMVCWASDLESA